MCKIRYNTKKTPYLNIVNNSYMVRDQNKMLPTISLIKSESFHRPTKTGCVVYYYKDASAVLPRMYRHNGTIICHYIIIV